MIGKLRAELFHSHRQCFQAAQWEQFQWLRESKKEWRRFTYLFCGVGFSFLLFVKGCRRCSGSLSFELFESNHIVHNSARLILLIFPKQSKYHLYFPPFPPSDVHLNDLLYRYAWRMAFFKQIQNDPWLLNNRSALPCSERYLYVLFKHNFSAGLSISVRAVCLSWSMVWS